MAKSEIILADYYTNIIYYIPLYFGEKKRLLSYFSGQFLTGLIFLFEHLGRNNFAAFFTEWKKNYLVDTVFENNHRRKSKVVNITWYMAWLMIVNNNQS